MNTAEITKDLTCSRCSEVQETYSEIVYSQGNKVCLSCKKICQASDDRAFDRDIGLGSVAGSTMDEYLDYLEDL